MLQRALGASMVYRKRVKIRCSLAISMCTVFIVFILATCTFTQSALGWEYQSELSKHSSQTDATKGFGGRYGVDRERQDEVSVQVNLYVHTIFLLL